MIQEENIQALAKEIFTGKVDTKGSSSSIITAAENSYKAAYLFYIVTEKQRFNSCVNGEHIGQLRSQIIKYCTASHPTVKESIYETIDAQLKFMVPNEFHNLIEKRKDSILEEFHKNYYESKNPTIMEDFNLRLVDKIIIKHLKELGLYLPAELME